MRRFLNVIVVLTCLAAGTARAAHTQAQLLLSVDAASPGDTIFAAVDMKMDSGWHTYWKNPGSAGQSTQIKWQLPPGVTAGEIQWPVPGKLPPADITTYGYENEVLLIVPLKLDNSMAAGRLNIAASVFWLECNQMCIPVNKDIQATLNVGSDTKPGPAASFIDTWRAKVPKPASGFIARAFWQGTAVDDMRPLLVRADWQPARTSAGTGKADFYPAASDAFEVQPETKIILNDGGEIELGKQVKKYSGDWPGEISGVLVTGDGAFDVELRVSDASAAK
jgi:DsbC/DsbD-like thiol-disulfide interchange protein